MCWVFCLFFKMVLSPLRRFTAWARLEGITDPTSLLRQDGPKAHCTWNAMKLNAGNSEMQLHEGCFLFLFAFCVFCSILSFPECFYICPVLGLWWRIPCLRGQNSCTSLTQTTPLSCRDSIDTFFCKNSQCHTTKEESNINRVPATAFGYSTQFHGEPTICIKIEMQRNTVMFKISEGALFLVVTMWCLREFCFLVLLCSVFAFIYFAMQFQCLVFFHSNHFVVFTGDENKLLVKNEK